MLVPDVSSADDDTYPALSVDGLSLSFSSDRPGGLGGSDVWLRRAQARAVSARLSRG